MPVTFTSRNLKVNEVRYGTVEKKVLELLRILDACYSLLVSLPIKDLTRHEVGMVDPVPGTLRSTRQLACTSEPWRW